MPKMIMSLDGVVLKEVELTKARTTLGRRPYNDIVIADLVVSGEHAALQMIGDEVFLEDLNSTNGTFINGNVVKRQLLRNGDSVEVGKYKIKFVNEVIDEGADEPPAAVAPSPDPLAMAVPDPAEAGIVHAAIKVLSGTAAGREVALTKVVTTIGKPGVAVAAITRRPHGFVVAHVEGAANPVLNGAPIGVAPVVLKNGDLIELAGTQMQFVQT